jgi:hypothetical protein
VSTISMNHTYKDLIGRKYDSSGSPDGAKRGPKVTPSEVVAEVLKLVRRNPEWGYERIASCMEYYGWPKSHVTKQTLLMAFYLAKDT